MSASVPQPGQATPASGPGGQDPSMEDILASIRRILSEDEQPAAKPAAPAAATADAEDDVLKLDETMLVAEPDDFGEPSPDTAAAVLAAISAPGEPLEVAPAMPEPPPVPAPMAIPVAAPAPAPAASDRLIAPEAEAATASALSSLVRTLESGRQAPPLPVYRGGPTLEDMVREEMRPLLKAWLDEHLPPMVERLVRTEIERVVGRAAG